MPRPLPNPSAKRSRAGSKRRAAGWMLLALGLLVAGVWLASGWWSMGFRAEGSACELSHGVLGVSVGKRPVLERSLIERNHPGDKKWEFVRDPVEYKYRTRFVGLYVAWYERWEQSSPAAEEWELNVSVLCLALWPLPLLLWTTGGLALWSGRRARRRALEGHCPTCGYNLAGLNRDAGVGVCPECGRKAAATA